MRPVRTRVGLGLVTLALVALPGCGAHADRRAAATDVCVSALPLARAVAGSGARLTRIKRLSSDDLQDLRDDRSAAAGGPAAPPSGTPRVLPTGGPRRLSLCAVAYAGSFDAARLPPTTHPLGGTGRVLVLLVSTRHPSVLSALVLPGVPPWLAR